MAAGVTSGCATRKGTFFVVKMVSLAAGRAARRPASAAAVRIVGVPRWIRVTRQHVTLRSKRRTSWRRREHVRRAAPRPRLLSREPGAPDFRICHLSIQKNHIHLIVEAADEQALSRGMQSFAIRAARAINRDDGCCGKVFAYRYHATQITTAKYARHALAYVLNNWRRHREDFLNGHMVRAQLDEFSSAVSFEGWTVVVREASGARAATGGEATDVAASRRLEATRPHRSARMPRPARFTRVESFPLVNQSLFRTGREVGMFTNAR